MECRTSLESLHQAGLIGDANACENQSIFEEKNKCT